MSEINERLSHGVAVEQHQGRVVSDSRFNHLMALSLDPKSDYRTGLIRCVTQRTGSVDEVGYLDRSALHLITGNNPDQYTVGEKLVIAGEDEVMQSLSAEGLDFLGLEDPDIAIDGDTTHVYFTVPFLDSNGIFRVHLGHAQGSSLADLSMTKPVLSPTPEAPLGAKELSVAPVNKQNVRLNLIETPGLKDGNYVSTVRSVIARQFDGLWEYGDVVFNPEEKGYEWCSKHVSPGPLLPRSFIDVGENRLLGILNGRGVERMEGDTLKFGKFSPGLMIYDYELGKIDWVSEKPLFQDTEARSITFASQFVQNENSKGTLYAHVDDTFVRAYTLDAQELQKLLPH